MARHSRHSMSHGTLLLLSQSNAPSITSLAFDSHKNTGNCSNATLNMRSYQLRSATLKYPTQMQGSNVSFQKHLKSRGSIHTTAHLSCGSMADGGRLSVGWTAAGFGPAPQQLFNSKACWQGRRRFEDFIITTTSEYVSELTAEQ